MLEWSYLVGPLVGGVIGYITNDVAIRMLFRPHQPKYLFGVHIPLTPGIIPKERYRIAEAVGETISEHLMNQEVLERTLLSPELIGRIAGAIDRFAAAQRTNEETLEQFIRHYLTRQELESMRGQVETDLTKMLYKKLSDESVGTKISHKIMEKVLEKMQSGMAGVVGSTLGLNQMAELVACVRAITRRKEEAPVMFLGFGDIELGQDARLICKKTGQEVKLGAKEYQLMELFLRNSGQTLPKDTLFDRVWGYDSEADVSTVEVYLSFLRKKLAFVGSAVKIKATRGIGYSLEENP